MKKPRRTRFKKTVMAVLLSGAGFFGFQAADVNDNNTKPVTDPVTTTTTNLYTLNAKEDLHTLATEQQRAEEERHFKWIESVGKMQPAALNNELIIAAMDNEPDRIRYLVNTMKADIHTEDNEALASAISVRPSSSSSESLSSPVVSVLGRAQSMAPSMHEGPPSKSL